MKKWVSTLLSILLLLNNFVTPISAIAETTADEQQTPVVETLDGEEDASIPEETGSDAPDEEDDAPAVVLIDGIDVIEELDGNGDSADETVQTGEESEDEGDASNYSAFVSGYAYTAASCDVYDNFDLADDELAAHVMGTLEAGQLVYAIDRYGDGVSDDDWMRIAFAVEQDGVIDFAQVYVPVSSLNAVPAEETDALKAELAAADNAASFDGKPLTPAAFSLKIAAPAADDQQADEEEEEDTSGDVPAPLPPVATVYEFACGLEAHTHTEACYNEAGEPTCGLVEHVHDANCLAAAQFEQPEEQPDYHWEEEEPTQSEETAEPITELQTQCGNSIITLTADPGVIPDGAELVAYPVDDPHVMISIFQAVPAGMDLESYAAYDIKLLVDGEEVEPSDDVHVEITNAISTVSLFSANVNEKQTVVFHISDEGAIPMTGLRDVTSTVRFDAPHFSIYAVAVFTLKTVDGTQNGERVKLPPIEEYYQTKTKNGHIKVTIDGHEEDIDLNSPAFDFHIFADEASLNQHTNGNVAANVLHGNGINFGNNQYKNSGFDQEVYIGERADGLGSIAGGGRVIIGSTVYWTEVDNGNHVAIGTAAVAYQDGKPGYWKDGQWVEITDWSTYKQASDRMYTNDVYQEQAGYGRYLDIEAELGKLSDTSKKLANATVTDGVKVEQDGTDTFRHKIDTKGKGDVVIVDIVASKYTTTDIFNVWTEPGQTVVINVDVTNMKDLSQWESHLNGLGNAENSIYYDCNLIWNFYTKDAANNKVPCADELKVGSGNGFFGTVLAPDSDLVSYGAINGTVIGKKTHQNGNESHQMFFHTGNSARYTVNKQLIDDPSAGKKTFYFALFYDKEGTNRVKDSPVVAVDVMPGETAGAYFYDLDEQYYVFETDASGNRITGGNYAIGGNGGTLGGSKTETTIVNSHKAAYAPQVHKTVIGAVDPNKVFEFVLTDGKGYTDTAEVKGAGTASFKTIEYDTDGTYTYTIKETAGDDDGITYDRGTWTVTVKVAKNDGKLSIASVNYAYSAPDSEHTASDYAEFVNRGPEKDEASFEPKVEKIVEAAPGSAIPDEFSAKFDFTLTLTAAKPESGVDMKIGDTKETFVTWTKDGPNEAATFGEVKFTEAGEYTFEIKEKKGDVKNVTYNTDPQTITVKVESKDGKLTATADPVSAKVTVTNTYEEQKAYFTPGVEKVVTGPVRDDEKNKTFTFDLTCEPKTGVTLGNTHVVVNEYDKVFNFGEVTFTQEGEYTFTITEVKPNPVPKGWTYAEPQTITVVVAPGKDGKLEAKVKDDGVAYVTAVNTYERADGSLTLKVKKNVTGPVSKADEDKEFTFELTADASNPAGATLPDNTTVTVTAKDDAKAFGDIEFTEPGVYKFTITEVKPEPVPNGWTYAEPQTVTVEVTDVGGKLATNYTDDTYTVTAVNTYGHEDGGFELGVKKSITGPVSADAKDKTFKFTLSAVDGNPAGATLTGQTTLEVTADGQPAYFGGIEFTEAGTYKFTLAEDKTGETAGWDYFDDKTITVEVKDVDGKLVATADGQASPYVVTAVNDYERADGSLTLKVKKNVTGPVSKADEDKTFTFELKADANNPAGATLPDNTTVTVTAKDDAKAFGDIEFTEPGVYTFTITEDKTGETDGWHYFEGETITVEVTDVGGKLATNYTDDTYTVTAVNTYTTTEASFTPSVEKVVTGTAPTKTFTFQLKDENGNVLGTATVNGEGTASFEPLTYATTGTFNYTVSEVAGDDAGFTYDTTVYNLAVTVEDVGGKLEATGVYNADPAIKAAKFTNEYTTKEATADFPFVKTMQGRDFQTGDSFTFTLKALTNPAPLPEKTSVTLEPTEGHEIGGTFGTATYTAVGGYDYTITEEKGTAKGVTYDGTTWRVHVEVTDNGEGQLVATTTFNDKESEVGAQFTNTYTYSDDPTIQPGVRKTLDIVGGDKAPEDLTFTFTLTDENEDSTGMVMPQQTEITVKATELVDNKDWTEKFGEIAFHKAGTYTFTIKETADESNTNVTYDKGTWTLTVEVVENDVHALEIKSHVMAKDGTTPETPDALDAVFANTYTTTEASFTPSVEKVVTGTAPTKTFTFQLKDENGNVLGTATVNGEGTASFEPLTYATTGTFNYTVSEVAGDDAGFTYDTTVYNLAVSVEDVGGKLEATGVYNADPAIKTATFTNTYEAAPTDYTPEVEKVIKGENPPEDEVFIFNLIDSDGTIIDTVRLYGAGKTSFDPIHYEAAGTYNYSIVEVDNKTNNWTFDDTVYGLTVVVTDVDAKLTVSAVYMLNGAPVPDNGIATFTNTYTQSDTSLAIGGIKRMAGRDFQQGDTFTFTLSAQTENAPMPAQTSVTVTPASGNEVAYSFGEITYDAVASYTYRITETASNAIENVTYDTTVWTVTVDVVRNTDNTLTANATYTSNATDGRRAGEFVNTYTIPEIEYVTLGGTKTWVDDGNSAGVRPAAIEVVLYANGVPQGNVPTWSNTDSDVWSYSFANLPATTADGTRIVYTVTETPVPLYESTQDGMNFINRLIPREEVEYTSVSGTKHWDDSDNARDVRPASVTIELLRNGEVIDQRTVSEANGWNYSFTNLPTGDGYGTAYTYEIREQMVSGYYTVYEGFDVTNVELPTPVLHSFTPGQGQFVSRQRPNFETYTEEELEDLIDLFDYGVPLFGMLLGTGDETPLYPFVFGGVGVIALAAALLIGRKKKAKAQ